MLALAACGTRLPDKDFSAAGQQQVVTGPGGVTSTTGPNGVVPTVSGLPSAGPSGGGTQNGGPIPSGDTLGGGVKPAGAGASGSGAGLTDNVNPTEAGRLNLTTEAGGPSLLTVSGVLLLIGLALFGLRWAAHRFGG